MTELYEVLFYAERTEDGLHRSARESAAVARRLADEKNGRVSAVLFGPEGTDQAEALIQYGADRVFQVRSAEFETYQPEAYTAALEQIGRSISVEVTLFGHTLHGVDLAPRLAWRLKAASLTDCVGFKMDDGTGQLLVERPVYGSKALAAMTAQNATLVATLRSKAFEPAEKDDSRTGEVIPFEVQLAPETLRIRRVESVQEESLGPKLEEAEIIVSGGRGLGSQEQFAMLEELARALGGVVGGSRVAIDNGWLPSSRQVGLTGSMVSPRLYIAVGISGATQHMAGCAMSECIVAINTDPDAPIFQRAHFGIARDFKQLLPKIIELCQSE